jgi:hypothetical protein
MIKVEQVKPGLLVRHKLGKLYKICSIQFKGQPETIKWGGPWTKDEQGRQFPACDGIHVEAIQWQINEKHPEGRCYQASRKLKLVDLTIE